MPQMSLRWIATIAFAALSTCAPVLAASTSAPADEYFGRYHLSILGIRNSLADMTVRARQEPDRAVAFLESAELTEDAIQQWQNRYPEDTWLPKSIFALEGLYLTIGGAEGVKHGVGAAAWLDRSFPGTAFAQKGDDKLAALNNSDDGTPSAAGSPTLLGVVPVLADATVVGSSP